MRWTDIISQSLRLMADSTSVRHWMGPRKIPRRDRGIRGHWMVQKNYQLVVAFGFLLILVSLCCSLMPSPLLAVLCFVVPAIIISALLRPHIALLLIFACAGFPALALPLPGYNMHLVEPALALCLLVVIVRHPPLQWQLCHLLMLLFLSIALLSFLHVPAATSNADSYAPIKRLLELVITTLAFFCGTFLGRSIKHISLFLLTIALVNLPPYLVGLAQVVGFQLPSSLEAPGSYNLKLTQGRLWGPFPWPVNFGMYLINLFAIALVCWLLGIRRWERFVGFMMLIATALAIIGTGTRSVAIAAGVILLIAFIVTRRLKLLITAFSLGSFSAIAFFNQVLPLFMHDETSTDNRFFIWSEAIKLIMANPWIGIGLQQFYRYYNQLIISKATELGPQGIHPHQQYLEWAMESGIPWLIIGVLLLISIILTCARSYRTTPREQQMILLTALLALLANSIIGLLDAPLDQLEGSVVLFLLAGLATGYTRAEKPMQRVHYAIPFLLPNLLSHFSPVKHVFSRGNTHRTPQQVHGLAKVVVFLGSRLRVETAPCAGRGRSTGTNRGLRRGLYAGKVTFAKHCRQVASNWTETTAKLPRNNKKAISLADTQKTGRSIVIQLLSWIIPLPLIFPMTALLTRYLGPVQYGEYSLTFPFLTIFALLSGTGMDSLIIRLLSNHPRQQWGSILSYAAGTRLLSTLLSAGIAVLIAWLLPISAEERNLFLIGSTSLFFSFSFNGFRIIYAHGFRAEQHIGILALLEICNRILTAALVALVVMLHLSLLQAYTLLIYSDVPACLLQIILASRRFDIHIRLSFKHFREHMLGGLPLIGHRVLMLVAGQIDLFLLLIVAGPFDVGIYALASRAIDPLISIAMAYVNGLYPFLCHKFAEGRSQFAQSYRQSTRILAMAIFPLATLVSVEAGKIVAVLGGRDFTAATSAVQLLMWAMVITFFNQIGEQACIAANMERSVPLAAVATTCANILANLLLIPVWQVTGAGIASLISECMGLCVFIGLLRQYIHPCATIHIVLLVLCDNIPATAFLLWQREMPPLLSVPGALLITVICYIATRVLSPGDVATFRQIFFIGKGVVKYDRRISIETQKLQSRIADEATLILPRIHV